MQTWWSFLKRQGVEFERVLGVDEAGRGPLAGPVVVAGVILPLQHGIQGLNDSKLLSKKNREEIYAEIMALSEAQEACQVYVEIASASTIDREGILNCTRRLMKRIVTAAQPDIALLDAVNVDLFNVLQLALTKGDQRVDCIAAASIIAKVERDALMNALDQQYPGYGLAEHKGYGTKAHREFLVQKGLTRIHRKSFCRSLLGDRG